MTMTINSRDFHQLTTALPALKKIYQSDTLQDYFEEEISSFLEDHQKTDETKILTSLIQEEVARLYDEETAKEVAKQLYFLPIVESGTHLAFLRDYDSPQKDETRSLLNQNILISASLLKKAGAKYHLGFYGSNVSLSHPCGGGYYQLGDELFPVCSISQTKKGILFQTPKISNKYLNEDAVVLAKTKLLNKTLETLIQTPETTYLEKHKAAKKLVEYLVQTKDLNAFQTAYNALKEGKKALLHEEFDSLNTDAKKITGHSFKEIDAEYQKLQQLINKEELTNLADQTTLVQNETINQILSGTGISQITVDGTEIAHKFLIHAMEDKNSLWNKIFTNPDVFKKFHQSLCGIRAAWKENESPFIGIGKDKEVAKSFNIPLEALSHDVATLVPLLKAKKIAPSSALTCLVTQSANILAHGGFFQSTYAEKMKAAFQKFLSQTGEKKLAKTLDNMPVDLMFLSLGVVANSTTKKPLKLSEIAKLPQAAKNRIVERIPYIGAAKSVLATANILQNYLNETAPGYIEQEAARNQEIFEAQKISTHKSYVTAQAALLHMTGGLARCD